MLVGIAVIGHPARQHDDRRAQRTVQAAAPAAASWAFRPNDLRGLVEKSEAVLEAEVVRSFEGEPLGASERFEDPHAAAIPTQRAEVRLLDELGKNRYGVGRDEPMVLFKTGGARPDGSILSLDGDPPYGVGESYVLFLVRRPDGTFLPVAPDGRLRIRPDGTLDPVIDGPVGDELRGRTKEYVRERVEDVEDD